jgi:hypothetical protein
MTEFASVFDLATGEHISTYMGADGSAKDQALPPGAGFLIIPADGAGVVPVLDPIKAYWAAEVDKAAEVQRETLITGGSGQAMTYMAKNAEALGWLANNAYPTPFLSAEATAIGSTVAALAAEVRDAALAWQAAGSAIEAKRRKAKVDILAASNIGEIYAAKLVEW